MIVRTEILDFKVGDIYLNNRRIQYRIVAITDHDPEKYRVTFHCEWTGMGPNPNDSGRLLAPVYRLYYPDALWQLKERNCAPCYDSDCDCIYDQIAE